LCHRLLRSRQVLSKSSERFHLLRAFSSVTPKLEVQGINAQYVLNDFVKECGGREKIQSLTVKEVYDTFIHPKIKAAPDLSYCSQLQQKTPDNASKTVRLPNYFLENLWFEPFTDVLDSLEHYFQEYPGITNTNKPKKLEDSFLYMDIFCESSKNLTEKKDPVQTYQRILEASPPGVPRPKVLYLLGSNYLLFNDTAVVVNTMMYNLLGCPFDIVLHNNNALASLSSAPLVTNNDTKTNLQSKLFTLYSSPSFLSFYSDLPNIMNLENTQPLSELGKHSLPKPLVQKMMALQGRMNLLHPQEKKEIEAFQEKQNLTIAQNSMDKTAVAEFFRYKHSNVVNLNEMALSYVLKGFQNLFSNHFYSPANSEERITMEHNPKLYLESKIVYNRLLVTREEQEKSVVELFESYEKKFGLGNPLSMKAFINLFLFYFHQADFTVVEQAISHEMPVEQQEQLRKILANNRKVHHYFENVVEKRLFAHFLNSSCVPLVDQTVSFTTLVKNTISEQELTAFFHAVGLYNQHYFYDIEKNMVQTENVINTLIELNILYFGELSLKAIDARVNLLNFYLPQVDEMEENEELQQQVEVWKTSNKSKVSELEKKIETLIDQQETLLKTASSPLPNAVLMELQLLLASIYDKQNIHDEKERQILGNLISMIYSLSYHTAITEEDFRACIHVVDYLSIYHHSYEIAEMLLNKLVLVAKTDEQLVYSTMYLEKMANIYKGYQEGKHNSEKKNEEGKNEQQQASLGKPVELSTFYLMNELPVFYPYYDKLHVVSTPKSAIAIAQSLEKTILPHFHREDNSKLDSILYLLARIYYYQKKYAEAEPFIAEYTQELMQSMQTNHEILMELQQFQKKLAEREEAKSKPGGEELPPLNLPFTNEQLSTIQERTEINQKMLFEDLSKAQVLLYLTLLLQEKLVEAHPFYENYLKMKDRFVEKEEFTHDHELVRYFGDAAHVFRKQNEETYFLEHLHAIQAQELLDVEDEEEILHGVEAVQQKKKQRQEPFDQPGVIFKKIQYLQTFFDLFKVHMELKDYPRAKFIHEKILKLMKEIQSSKFNHDGTFSQFVEKEKTIFNELESELQKETEKLKDYKII
jgi:hypothetical protein